MDFTLKYRSRIIISAYKDWISNSDRVLDIGCGNAVVSEELKKHFQCLIVGTDVLDYRKRVLPFKAVLSGNKLPFENREFDVSMFNDTLHHCSDWKTLFNEAIRVSKRVLIFETESSLLAKLLDSFINRVHNPNMNQAINLMKTEEWIDCFRDLKLNFEYRKLKKPLIFYPFNHFAFKISQKV